MPRPRLLVWPRLAYPLIGLLAASGSLIFLWFLLFDLEPSDWSQRALGFQVGAAIWAALLFRWQPPRRLIVYPALLAFVIYLWDHTLPPVSVPEGPARWWVPRLVLVGVLADWCLWARQRPATLDRAHSLNGRAKPGPRPPALPKGIQPRPLPNPDTAPENHFIDGFDGGYQGHPRPAQATPAYLPGWRAGRQQHREMYGHAPGQKTPSAGWFVVLLIPFCLLGVALLGPGTQEWWLILLLRSLSGSP